MKKKPAKPPVWQGWTVHVTDIATDQLIGHEEIVAPRVGYTVDDAIAIVRQLPKYARKQLRLVVTKGCPNAEAKEAAAAACTRWSSSSSRQGSASSRSATESS